MNFLNAMWFLSGGASLYVIIKILPTLLRFEKSAKNYSQRVDTFQELAENNKARIEGLEMQVEFLLEAARLRSTIEEESKYYASGINTNSGNR